MSFKMERMASSLEKTMSEVKEIFDIIVRIQNDGYVIVDLKLENFMVSREGKVKMIDLGLIERYLTYDKKHRPEVKGGKSSGTPLVMSLRLMEKKSIPARRDDLESFVYLWEEVVSDALPWDGLEESAIIEAKKNYKPHPSISEFFKIVRGIEYDETPPYDELRQILHKENQTSPEDASDSDSDFEPGQDSDSDSGSDCCESE